LKGLGNLGGFLKQNFDKVLLGIMLVLMAVGLWYASNVVQQARENIKEAEGKVGDSVPDAKVQDLDRTVFTAVVPFDDERDYNFLIDKAWKPGTDKPKPEERGRPWLRPFEEQVSTNLPIIPSEHQASMLALVPRSLVDPPLFVYSKEQSKHLVHADTIENPFTRKDQRCDVDKWVTWLGKKDSDEDGIPDAREKEAGLDPNSAADANCDVDGDGFSNIDEFEWDQTGAAISDPNSHPPSVKHLRYIGAQKQQLRILLNGIDLAGKPTDNRAWQMRLQVWSARARRMVPVTARLGGQIPGTNFRIINAEYRENRQGGSAAGVEKSEIQIQEGQNDPISLQLNVPPRSNQVLRVKLIHLDTRQQSVAMLNVPTKHTSAGGSEETFTITQDASGERLFANIGDQKIEIKQVDRVEFDNFPSRFSHCNGAAPDPEGGLPPIDGPPPR
jgi:hypothetical protein